jgi:putative FmdB family regulatory protein
LRANVGDQLALRRNAASKSAGRWCYLAATQCDPGGNQRSGDWLISVVWRMRIMAIYEFECQACGKHFEVRMPMSTHEKIKESPLACPACGKPVTRQVVSEFACKTSAG